MQQDDMRGYRSLARAVLVRAAEAAREGDDTARRWFRSQDALFRLWQQLAGFDGAPDLAELCPQGPPRPKKKKTGHRPESMPVERVISVLRLRGRRLKVAQIAEQLHLSTGMVSSICTNYGLRKNSRLLRPEDLRHIDHVLFTLEGKKRHATSQPATER